MARRTQAGSDVTVIIPMYNKEATIERCVRSVLAQTAPPSRILIVDDKSTDRSLEVAERLRGLSAAIEIVRLAENEGAAHARNHGAKAAGTQWIAFLDSDDHWRPQFLERLLAGATRVGAGFASCGRTEIFSRRQHRQKDILLTGEREGSAIDLTDDFWKISLSFTPINSSANLIDRALFLSVGGFEEKSRYWEDHILWCRLWRRTRFAFVNEPLSQYYKAPGTLSAGAFFFRDALRFEGELMRALGQSALARRAGGLDLLVYLLRFSILIPGSWISRRIARPDRRPGREE